MKEIKGVEVLYRESGFEMCRHDWCGAMGTYKIVWKEDGEEWSTCACLRHLNKMGEVVVERLRLLKEKVIFN